MNFSKSELFDFLFHYVMFKGLFLKILQSSSQYFLSLQISVWVIPSMYFAISLTDIFRISIRGIFNSRPFAARPLTAALSLLKFISFCIVFIAHSFLFNQTSNKAFRCNI